MGFVQNCVNRVLKMKGLLPWLWSLLGAVTLMPSCQQPTADQPTQSLYALFPVHAEDTLYALFRPDSSLGRGDIPQQLLHEAIGDSLIAVINPEYDSTITTWQAQARIDWDATRVACLLTSETSWWVHGGLIFYDKQSGRFTSAFPVSLLYGGDGSQLMQESLILDIDGDGDRDVVTYELFHALRVEEEEMIDVNERHLQVHTWVGDGFQSEVPADSLRWMQVYEIDW